MSDFDLGHGKYLATAPTCFPCPVQVASLISQCWAQESTERPTFEDIVTKLMAILADVAPAQPAVQYDNTYTMTEMDTWQPLQK